MRHYTVLVVESIRRTMVQSVQKLQALHPEFGEPHIALCTTDPGRYQHYGKQGVVVIGCDFKPAAIRRALHDLPFPVAAVLCRGEAHIQYLRKLVPLLSPAVRVAGAAALRVATNKRLMREAFMRHWPAITPRYLQVMTADAAPQVAVTLPFPVIVKPASLASSLLIQRCDSLSELQRALASTFASLKAIYRREGRSEAPEVIVEEYLEGDYYSVDSYVLEPGDIYHLPLVRYVPAKQLGIDDFFLYKRMTPVDLPNQEVKAARRAAAQAVAAAGLRYSTVHIELVRTESGSWKIIEIGPRPGRFRSTMYYEAFGIDHDYNDLLVHMGLQPDIRLQRSAYCAAYSIYPEHEGILQAITGLQDVRANLPGIIYARDRSTLGEMVQYARNGGHALYEAVFVSSLKAEFEKECTWMEANVHAVVTGTVTV